MGNHFIFIKQHAPTRRLCMPQQDPIAKVLVQDLVTIRATGGKFLARNYAKGQVRDKLGVQA